MMHFIPAFATAMQDRALRGHAREIYLWLNERLDIVDYRPVKHYAIAHDLRVDKASVFRAMKLLETRGYIHRDERARGFSGGGRVFTYRLVYSVATETAVDEKTLPVEIDSAKRNQ